MLLEGIGQLVVGETAASEDEKCVPQRTFANIRDEGVLRPHALAEAPIPPCKEEAVNAQRHEVGKLRKPPHHLGCRQVGVVQTNCVSRIASPGRPH